MWWKYLIEIEKKKAFLLDICYFVENSPIINFLDFHRECGAIGSWLFSFQSFKKFYLQVQGPYCEP